MSENSNEGNDWIKGRANERLPSQSAAPSSLGGPTGSAPFDGHAMVINNLHVTLRESLMKLGAPIEVIAMHDEGDTDDVLAWIEKQPTARQIRELEASERCLEREVQHAVEAIPREFLANDAWENGVKRMAAEIERLRGPRCESCCDLATKLTEDGVHLCAACYGECPPDEPNTPLTDPTDSVQ